MIAAGIVFITVAAISISITAKQESDNDAVARATTTSRAPTYHYTASLTPAPALPPPVATTEPARSPVISNDELFIATLTAEDITVLDDGDMVALGKAVCSDLDRGLDFTSIGIDVMRSSGGLYSLPDVGFIMGAAVSAYCPEHKGDMPGR